MKQQKKNGRSLQPLYYSYIFLITDKKKTIPVRKEKKRKEKQKKNLHRSSLMKERAGTAKLLLDIINTQKNDAR